MDAERKTGKGKDYFGDFLKSMSGVTSASAPVGSPADASGLEPNAAVESRSPQPALSLPAVLAYLRERGDVSLPDLAAGLKSPILQTAELIGKLEASGLLTVQGDPGSERVRLTEAGVNLSSVA